VSDPAFITIIEHPLRRWYNSDRDLFRHVRYRFNDIAYGNGYFVAVGYDGRFGRITYSNDGITWERADITFDSRRISVNAVTYGNGRFVAVGTNGKTAYSTDAKTWIPVENIVSNSLHNIVYGNGRFIASFGTGLVYSNDGESWQIAKDFDTSWISCINFVNNRFILGNNAGEMFFSDNGETWTAILDDTFNDHSILTISYGNGRYLAFASRYNDYAPSSYIIGYSDNGERWTAFTPSKFEEDWNWIRKIIYSEGYFVAVGNDREAFSNDGINWVYLGSYLYMPIRYNAIVYGNGYFVVVGENIIRYCQWPIVKAMASVIIEQPRWPSNRRTNDGAYLLTSMWRDRSYGNSSFQWYKNDTENTATGTAIEGATKWSYAPDVSRAGTTYYYLIHKRTIPDFFEVEIENRKASTVSNIVAVTVDLPIEITNDELDK
jgi:hypothetical protein